MKEIGLYIHIPFCKQKCYYCDFCSYANKLELQERYVNALIKELNHIKDKNIYKIKTIYIGGGTPSIIKPVLIQRILFEIRSLFVISEDAEITIEINPGTVDKEKIDTYKISGINRISIGLQSTNDKLLKEIGRIHNYNDFEIAYALINEAGFFYVNVDLMIGLPNQTLNDVKETIKKIVLKNPTHISVYSLIVEPETTMQMLINSNKLELPDEDLERAMYWSVKELLERSGYIQYEISNFAPEGNECKHNILYWTQENVIALGAAAVGYIDGVRYKNPETLEKYFEAAKNNFPDEFIEYEILTPHEKQIELAILKLRTKWGIKKSELLPEVEAVLNSMPSDLFINTPEKISLSKRGMRLGNSIWCELIDL